MRGDLRGQTAIVTGGSRGIGLAIARALVGAGAHVVVVGRHAGALSEARRAVEPAGPRSVEALEADVRRIADVERVVAAAIARFGGVDILVNNAAVGIFHRVEEMPPSAWAEVIDTNLTGVFNCCHAVLPHMKERGGGYIVNISSLAGANPFATAAAYCASKAGLNAFSEALMQEVRHDGIRVSYVMPGSVATGFSSGNPSRGADWKTSPAEVADVVLGLLLSDPRSIQSRVELRPSRPQKK